MVAVDPESEPILTLEEARGLVGRDRGTFVAPPIAIGDIRRWAIAVYWPETPPPLFWDEEIAARSRWGGIIAPQEFNPFAWPVSGPGLMPPSPPLIHGGRKFNTGSRARYGAPMRPGDVIEARNRVVGVVEKDGRSGHLVFITTETVWTNQRGEFVKAHETRIGQVIEGYES